MGGNLLDNYKIFCITFNIKEKFGGMTASLLKRAKIFGEQKNIPVTVVTFAMNYELRNNAESLKGNKLGKNTEVVNLYEFLSGDQFKATKFKEHEINEVGCSVLKENNKRQYKIFRNGKLVMKKDFETYEGKLSSISYFNDELNVYKKEEYDKHGYLRRTIYYNTINGKMKQVLFYRLDGTCYLNKELDYHENKYNVRKIYNFDKNNQVINVFNSDEEMKKYFLDNLTEEKQHNYFIVDSEAMFPDIINYKNKNNNEVYKIYLNHNPHTNFPYNFDSPIRETMKLIYNNIEKHDAIIVLTNEQKRDINLRFRNLNNCFLIPHSFSGNCSIGNFKKRNLNKIISVARFDEQKQNDHLIKAFHEVVKVVPNAVLEFYGFGDKQQEMENLIEELELFNNVFIKGFTNDIETIFKTAAFKVMSSKYEGQPLAILESLSFGCPVISYDTKYGPQDMIIDGKNGYIVEYNNIGGLAKAMIDLLKNPEKIKLFSEQCPLSLENYTDEVFMQNWANLFEELRRIVSNILNNIHLDTGESKWIDLNNKIFSINTKIIVDEDLKQNINMKTAYYTLVNRDTNEKVNITNLFKNKEMNTLISDLNLDTDFLSESTKCGYYDIYLSLDILGESKMIRCGCLNKIEEFEIVKNLDGKFIKPYYTKHNNLTLHIK